MNNTHIVSAFDAELDTIGARIAEMGALAEEQLGQALDAIRLRDVALAEQVIAADAKLDELEVKLEELTIQTLALRQPMAGDLRQVVAALKIASTLERIGDLAKSIARRTSYFKETHPAAISASILRMGQQCRVLVAEVLDAYDTRDTALAVSVWSRDIEIDEMHNAVFRELVSYMIEDPHLIGLCSQLLFVAKNLERIGDHATFIAEMTFFVVEGKPLREGRPKGEPLGDPTQPDANLQA